MGKTDMATEILVHESKIELHGMTYEIRVFCCENGRHFASTSFSDTDIIINDGPTLSDALLRHRSILPLAVSSRDIIRFSMAARSKAHC